MKKERKQEILDTLERCKYISTEQGVKLFGVSEATIRRSFNELAEAGLAGRTHGGLKVLDSERTISVPLGLREEWNSEEKHRLAEKAVSLVGEGASVMIYGGSTVNYAAWYLNSGSIVTNMPGICRHLMERFPTGDGPRVTLIGGNLDFRTGNLQGVAACAGVERYFCDVGICSAYGLDEDGLMDIDDECSSLMEKMMLHSKKRIVMADHTKFNRKGLCRSLDWSRIDLLVTTFCPENHEILNEIRKRGPEIVLLGNSDSPRS